MNWNEQLPEWNAEGTEPPAQKKVDGWQPGEKPPAGWWNWLSYRTYKALQEIRSVIDNLTGMEVHGNEYHDPDLETPTGAQGKVDTAINQHMQDYIRQPGYAVATGSANTYAVTLNLAPIAYVDGMAVSLKINIDNTGPSTININSLGPKNIKKPNGNDVSSGNLKAGSIYSLRYNGINFILQGSDAAGDATPAEVLSGKTFTNDLGEQIGTLALTGDAAVGDVLSGKTFYNNDAKTKRTGSMSNRTGHVNAQSRSYTGNTLRLRPQVGHYPGDTGNSVQDTDNNWLPENIRTGVNIFGKVGALYVPTAYVSGLDGLDLVTGYMSNAVATKENNHLWLSVNPSSAGEATFVTNNVFNLSDYAKVFAYWEPIENGSRYYSLVASTNKTANRDTFNARIQTASSAPPQWVELDVLSLTGNHYIRLHVHQTSSWAQPARMKVYNLLLMKNI